VLIRAQEHRGRKERRWRSRRESPNTWSLLERWRVCGLVMDGLMRLASVFGLSALHSYHGRVADPIEYLVFIMVNY
jgi:hypothetical protein